MICTGSRMSIKTILISAFAASAAVAVVGLVSGRRDVLSREPSPRGRPLAATKRTRLAELPPRHMVLPIAFWDAAADEESEDELPRDGSHALGSPEEPYDSIAPEDASVTWLARATQTHAAGTEEIDDPAEIAADSMSMISEASRSAADVDPSGFDDEPSSQAPDSVA